MARYAGRGKTTVESCRSIDVLDWHRRGYLGSPRWFSWAWTRDGKRVASINVEAQRQSVTLKYRSRSYGEDWSDVEQRIALVWTPCRLGGERPWFTCSVASNGVYCGRRVIKLYGVGRLFACRHCYRLAYTSQSEGVLDRANRRASKIRRRLGGDAGPSEPFPEKPKGMWQRKYERLRERAVEAEAVANHAFTIQAERLLAGLDRRKRRRGFWR
jgi:hypothetical protein